MDLLTDRIKDEMKAAMKGGDKFKLGVIRLILAAIKQVKVDERITLDNDRTLQVLDKMLKQRRESIKQYSDAGRIDLADAEEAEVRVIQEFLPAALSDAEIDALVQEAIAESGAASIKDMGKVMGVATKELAGKADGREISAKVKQLLG